VSVIWPGFRHVGRGLGPIQVAAVFGGAGVLGVLLGQVLELGAGLDLGDQLLGVFLVVDEDVARVEFLARLLGLDLVVLGLGFRVADRVRLDEVLEQRVDQHRLANQFELALVVGRVGDAGLLGFLSEDLAHHDLVTRLGLHLRGSVLASASTRALGTGLPFTTAMFWAIAASGSTRVPISAAEILKFMLGDFRANVLGSEQGP